MARPLTKEELERMAVDFPVIDKDETEQTVSDRFINVQTERLKRNPRDEEDQDLRQDQKRAEYAEAMEAAAYQEEMFEQQQAAFAAEKVTAAEQMRDQGGGLAGKAATQTAAVAMNTPTALWMTAWHTWAYLTFQIPLAALSIILFGLTVSLEQSWLTRQFSSLLSLVSLSPQDFFMTTNMILWGLSLFGLIVTMFAYLIRGQSPLGGDKMTAKMFAILGCIMGYSLPLFNLFPWIGIYIFVMWTSRD